MEGRLTPTTLDLTENTGGWQYAESTDTDVPSDFAWVRIERAGTVANVLKSLGRWHLDGPPVDFDARVHWFRLHVPAQVTESGTGSPFLIFEGLATLCKVWLNGHLVLESANMFRRHTLDVTGIWAASHNELLVCFEPLGTKLQAKRPRPAWRTPMVAHQQLRWIRTTLLGRLPGWCPPVAPVGIWKPIRLEWRQDGQLVSSTLQPRLEGDTGVLKVRCVFATPRADTTSWSVQVNGPGDAHHGQLVSTERANEWTCTISIPSVDRWWPHTHGEPALYSVSLTSAHPEGPGSDSLLLGKVGFRTVQIDDADGQFAILVNGVNIFCRGACWMPLDIQSLSSSPEETRTAVKQVQAAGMNMLRIPGSTLYQDTSFFDACDELGVLVWHDLMFSNMDYPTHDAGFVEEAMAEVEQQVQSWSGHPSLAVVCGNSEVEQQAAMWGAPRDRWKSDFFELQLSALVRHHLPFTPYWPSSAHGGSFPHQPDTGTSSYYGVGAYKRPLDDALTSQVAFATECLAFANVPNASTLKRAPCGEAPQVHSPAWKSRVFRDQMVGWDFDDVRDHYVQTLLHLDPQALRAYDPVRHLKLGRAIGAEVMARTMALWRTRESRCRGALVWYLRDLWAGAGCGLTDELGSPKPVLHALSRVQKPVLAVLTDHGLNGLALQLVNDTAHLLRCKVHIQLYQHGQVCVAQHRRSVEVQTRSSNKWNLVEWLPGFMDLNWSYRFGPPSVDLVAAHITDERDSHIATALYFDPKLMLAFEGEPEFSATAEQTDPCRILVHLVASSPLFAVHFDVHGWQASDEYFHMPPGSSRTIEFIGSGHWYACVEALNSRRLTPVVIKPSLQTAGRNEP